MNDEPVLYFACMLATISDSDIAEDLPTRCRHQFTTGTCNYIPHILLDVITCPFHLYLLLVHKSSYLGAWWNTPNLYLVLQHAVFADAFVKDVFAHVCVHGTQGVIQQVDVSLPVHGSGQGHPLLLATGQVDTLDTDTYHDCISYKFISALYMLSHCEETGIYIYIYIRFSYNSSALKSLLKV